MKFSSFKWYKQKPSMCGPAAIRIAISYFGLVKSEEEIIELTKSTKKDGTSHRGILRALLKFDFSLCSSSDGTIDILRSHLKGGSPCIVGFIKGRSDHFGIVYRISNTHVYLIDPEEERYLKIPLEDFLKQWHDYDPVQRENHWYVCISKEKNHDKKISR